MQLNNLSFDLWHVNTFTSQLFSGNPAMVCLLPYMLPDPILQKLAQEHAQPVTAFLVRKSKEIFIIRWFTPENELDLCGHGSLAAGYVIFNHIEPMLDKIYCQSRLEQFTITRQQDLVTLDFPAKEIEPIDVPWLVDALGGLAPLAVYQHRQERCMVVYASEEEVKSLQPDFNKLQHLTHYGVVVTARGHAVDFVSRTFYPKKSVKEDAVTGASHCLLVPYWSKQFNKTELHALQLSQRGGELFCRSQGNRVQLSGHTIAYLTSQVLIINSKN